MIYGYNDRNKRSRPLYKPFRNPLSPDIEYGHKYPKKSSNRDLNRALGWQKKERNKSEKKKYFRDYKDIERICYYLQLNRVIFLEAMNIRKQIGKVSNYFDRKTYYKNMACVKIAMRIHDFQLNEKDFIQLMRNYPIIEKGEKIQLRGNEVKKEIDKKYVEIMHKYLKIKVKPPITPNFINYACNELGIPEHAFELYKLYWKHKKQFNPSCSLQGYILAMIHILYAKTDKIRIITMEEKFAVNRLTISSRKKELVKMMK